MAMVRFGIGFALSLALFSVAGAQLTTRERVGLEQTLMIGNMTLKDLDYQKYSARDPYRLNLIESALDRPMGTVDALMLLHAFPKSASLPSILERAGQLVSPGNPAEITLSPVSVAQMGALPEDLRLPVANLVGWVQRTNLAIRQATQKLKPEEVALILDSVGGFAAEDPAVKLERMNAPVKIERMMPVLGKVDVGAMIRASGQLASAMERLSPIFAGSKSVLASPVELTVDGIRVRIAGRGNDVHDNPDCDILIDLGGRNHYTGRVGVGIQRASVLLDFGTHPSCRVGDLSMGTGVLGVGLVKFASGDGDFRGGSMTFGCGLAGVGAFAKDAGDDVYRTEAMTQGFGFFGVGLLVDNRGEDDYDAKLYAQGAARTKGLGWLIDRRGNDRYRAGGLSMNSPLFSDATYSNAQGFASGYREDTGGYSGGIGLLTDFGGDDQYQCDTYGQAASYWFALGSLYDAGGNDRYSAVHYAQSSAMHLTAAYLFDLAGHDCYTVRVGACQSIGHDYGVSFFLDREGDDLYTQRDGAPGTGTANGVGVFLDSAGDDRYSGMPASAQISRSSGSLAIFADLGGIDRYRDGLADGSAALLPTWGVAYDEESLAGSSFLNGQPPKPRPKPGSIPKPSDAELAKLFAQASQWAVGSAQDSAWDAVDRLIGIGVPAFEWVLANRMEQADRLSLRAVVSMANGIGAPARERVAAAMFTAKDPVAEKLLRVAVETGTKEAGPMLPGFMKKEKTVRMAVRAAAILGGPECVAELLPLCLHEDRQIATGAMIALAEIGSELAYTTAEAIVTSGEVMARKAALKLMSKFPNKAMASAARMVRERDERVATMGAELFGLIGSQEALTELGKLLSDPTPSLRIQALLGLNRRCPEGYKSLFQNARNDPSPLVRAVASRLSP